MIILFAILASSAFELGLNLDYQFKKREEEAAEKQA